MALRKEGKYYYGDNQDDLAFVLREYAKSNKYPIDEITEVKCVNCGHQIFKLLSDDDGSGAICQCVNCSEKKVIEDSQRFINLEEIDNCECMCDNTDFAPCRAVGT